MQLLVDPAERPSIRHPAKYTDKLLPVFARMIRPHVMSSSFGYDVLDPFAGTGKIHLLAKMLPIHTYGIEIEPEWAAMHPRTTLGDALDLPWDSGRFDAIVTSPCLAHGHRVLRRDLRWTPVERVIVGDELIAFDEFGDGKKENGHPKRRKWRFATVLRSVTRHVECVNVHLSNGDIITCTPEHPWLAQRYKTGGNQESGNTQWVQTKDLLSSGTYRRRVHGVWKDIPKKQTGWWVHKQLDVWEDNRSYEAGWLAGIMDGEGSLSSRSLQATEKIQVIAIEDAGLRAIQEIETSTGTYIGDGYLHHNCYGNRMADSHVARDSSRRNTYTHAIGRTLSPGSAGTLQWGDGYRDFHFLAWLEAHRVLSRKGIFILNIKDHIRAGKQMHVTDWHIETILAIGFKTLEHEKVDCPGNGYGQNGNVRIPYESVIKFEKR